MENTQSTECNKKFFICILSHKGSNFRDSQMEKLIRYNNENIIFYYFIGDPDQKEEWIIDSEKKVIRIKCADNYESLPMKTYRSLEYAFKNHFDEIEGVFKTDDDIDLDLDLLYKNLCKNSELEYFGNPVIVRNEYMSSWHFGKCEDANINTTPQQVPISHYCSGGGYYINKKNLHRILEMQDVFTSNIFEDVCTGIALNSIGVYPDNGIDIRNMGCVWE